jgi:UDP-glucose 4-epimerase
MIFKKLLNKTIILLLLIIIFQLNNYSQIGLFGVFFNNYKKLFKISDDIISKEMKITVLITGGLGYIGSNICLRLLKNEKYNVIIVDNLSNSNINRLQILEKLVKKKILFFKYNINDVVSIEKIFEQNEIDIVIHLANFKAVNESINYPLEYYSNNVVGTINLLRLMEKYHCNKIIFSSSATVYGNDKSPPFKEDMITNINLSNPYAKSKLIIEEILKDVCKSNKNFNVIILRYFNPIGSDSSGVLYDDPNGIPQNLFPYILKVYKNLLPELFIFGTDYNTKDGTCIRDFIHINDLADGHIAAINYILNNSGIEIFNLGTGKGSSILELLETFERVNNIKLKIKIVNRRDGDIASAYADVTKANKILGWKAEYDLEKMVKQ